MGFGESLVRRRFPSRRLMMPKTAFSASIKLLLLFQIQTGTACPIRKTFAWTLRRVPSLTLRGAASTNLCLVQARAQAAHGGIMVNMSPQSRRPPRRSWQPALAPRIRRMQSCGQQLSRIAGRMPLDSNDSRTLALVLHPACRLRLSPPRSYSVATIFRRTPAHCEQRSARLSYSTEPGACALTFDSPECA